MGRVATCGYVRFSGLPRTFCSDLEVALEDGEDEGVPEEDLKA